MKCRPPQKKELFWAQNRIRVLPGQYFDAESGLNYNYFRDYNPAVGRYVQADPIGLDGEDPNLFVYVQNSPIIFFDPDGLKRVAYLYQKVGPKGEHLKYGITYDPNTRYTKKELGEGGLRIIAKGSREEMLALERNLHKTLPLGPEERQCAYLKIQKRNGLNPRIRIRGLKGVGILGYISAIMQANYADKKAKEYGVSPWTIMLYEMQGVEVNKDTFNPVI